MLSPRLLALALATLPLAAAAWACCGVGRVPIVFLGQTNLIVWDEDQQIEHFVRSANFASAGPDLGFIAPTPTTPTLAKANAAAFDRLAALAPPPPPTLDSFMPSSSAMKDVAAAVQVIQQVDVAGYRATTLRATDSQALANWMAQNGYQTSPSIREWTEFYLRKGWYLTAFRVNLAHGQGTTGPVRMSFRTSEPFNPYYVPKTNQNPRGTDLKLYFIANRPHRPTIGQSTPWIPAAWSANLPAEVGFQLADDLGLLPESIPTHAEVTAYDDPTFTKGATDDIYFHRESSLPPLPLCLAIGAASVLAIHAIRKSIRRRKNLL